MSLKDSLNTASIRVGKTNSEANMERTIIENYKKAVANCIEASLQETINTVYKQICDAVADQIYINSNDKSKHIEGFIDMPRSIPVKIQDLPEYHDYHSKVFSAYYRRYNNGIKFQEDADAIHKSFPICMPGEYGEYSVIALDEFKNSGPEGFGIIGYHYNLSMDLTEYGRRFVDGVARLAQNDGIQVFPAVIFEVWKRGGQDVEYTKIKSLGRMFRIDSEKNVSERVILKYSYN